MLEALAALTDKNLLRRAEQQSQPGELRFAMLAVLAEFAREKLAAEPHLPALQGMYLRHYAAAAERHRAQVRTPEAARHMAWLRGERQPAPRPGVGFRRVGQRGSRGSWRHPGAGVGQRLLAHPGAPVRGQPVARFCAGRRRHKRRSRWCAC